MTTNHNNPNDRLQATIRLERALAARAWSWPTQAYNAAVRHQLCGDCFADRTAGHMFTYVLAVAELGRVPDADVCAELAYISNIVLSPIEILDLIIAHDDGRSAIDELAEGVAATWRERTAAREAWRDYHQWFGGVAGPDFHIRPARRRPIARRLQRVRRTVTF